MICPTCLLAIGGGFFILNKLGVNALISVALIILLILYFIFVPKKQNTKAVEGDDFFSGINKLIKKILNCCG